MKLLYWFISRLPYDWKWVRKKLGGKWKCYYWLGDYDGLDTPYFYFFRPENEKSNQLWLGKPQWDEDYTEPVPMLPMPTELTGYRG